jgi:hypothetical protein
MLPFSMVCPAKSKFNFHVVLDGNYKLTCRQTELVNYFFFKIKYFENILAKCRHQNQKNLDFGCGFGILNPKSKLNQKIKKNKKPNPKPNHKIKKNKNQIQNQTIKSKKPKTKSKTNHDFWFFFFKNYLFKFFTFLEVFLA